MATRLKTVEYWFPQGTANDASDTNLTQITVDLPESSKAFKSVVLEMVFHDRSTTIGSVTRRQVSLQLGSAGYSAVNSTTTITNGGEQQTLMHSGDFTSYFTTNWSGTSMTCDARLYADSNTASPLTPNWVNISARLVITYEYDDTSSTQVKTVRIPLNVGTGALEGSKGSADATIPALDTELPESTKTYKQKVIVVQGLDQGTSTDLTLNWQVESDTAFASYSIEHGSNVAMFGRWNSIESFLTNTTRNWYIWGSSTVFHHVQAWLVVTYTFDATASTDCFVSVKLPMSMDAFGSPTSGDYQRNSVDLWIEEPTTITTKQIAFYAFWDEKAVISGLNMRVGTGSFVAYTDNASIIAGSDTALVVNNTAFSLARGKNTLTFDAYNTDGTDVGMCLDGFWIVNYTCGKPSGGYGAANHTVEWMILPEGTAALDIDPIVTATALTIPETAFFMNHVGLELRYTPSGTTAFFGMYAAVERLAAEGGVKWEEVFNYAGDCDGETGIYYYFGDASAYFDRFVGDLDSKRFDIETARRWRAVPGNQISGVFQMSVLFTYHAKTFTISGTVSGYTGDGSGITVTAHRVDTGEAILSTTTAAGGTYSMTWYDDTVSVYCEARQDSTHLGRSENAVAT